MKHITFCILACAFLLLISGCVPEQMVIWSPDGTRAVVLGREDDEQTLYLCDESGRLSSRLLHHALRVAWRPDSRGLVVSHGRIVTAWADIEPLLAPEERSELLDMANTVYRETQSGDTKGSLEAALGEVQMTDNHKNVMRLYFRHHHADLVAAGEEEEEEPVHVVLSKVETASVHGLDLQMDGVIAASTMPIWGLRVSPGDLAVAYTAGGIDLEEPPLSLYVAGLDGTSPPQRIARNVSMYADWSADGEHLVYAVSNSETRNDKLQLGAIARSRVADASGRILDDVSARDDLAGVIMNIFGRVRCVPDGHIVFSAHEAHLPATANDIYQQATLFGLHPDRKIPVSRLLPRDVEPYLAAWSGLFEFSPDYGRIAFPDSDSRVSIFDLTTGDLQQTPGHPQSAVDPDRIKNLPSWKSAEELCFTRTVGTKRGKREAEVLIYSFGQDPQARMISADWPADLLDSMVD